MTDRSEEQVKREIEAEREQLKGAVGSFREHAHRARRRLPFVAAGALAAAVVLRTVTNRVARRL